MRPYRPIKTIRTDTTLDLSQKAEKSGCEVDWLFASLPQFRSCETADATEVCIQQVETQNPKVCVCVFKQHIFAQDEAHCFERTYEVSLYFSAFYMFSDYCSKTLSSGR